MVSFKVLFATLLLGAVAVYAQDETTEVSEVPTSATPRPRQPYGALCNGLLLQCNRYSETVACLQRRPDPPSTTTTEASGTEEPESVNPVIALFQKSRNPAPRDICETGLGVNLGRCQCMRNCKEGVYVDDGEFDPEREICVGLVGSRCSLLVPNCTKNARCNFLTSACVCQAGFVENDRRCVPASN